MRAFSDVIKSAAPKETGQKSTLMGTVTNVNGGITVQIDGSEIKTPATTLVGVDVGDRVDVLLQNHRALITGNRSAPAITRYGNTYIKLADQGLIIGILNDQGQPVGGYLLVNPNTGAFQVMDPNGVVLASFAQTATIGKNDGARVYINQTDVSIIDGNGETVAVYGAKSRLKQIETDNLIVNGASNTNARVWVQGFDSSDNMTSSIQLRADVNGVIGLYDTLHEKWLIIKNTNNDVQVCANPTLLSSTEYAATAISDSTYVNIPIANMSTWSMIIAYVAVSYEYTTVTFIKGGPTYQNINCYNGTRVITGRVTADWTNNRLRLSCTRGSGTDYTQVKLRNIYGILKA